MFEYGFVDGVDYILLKNGEKVSKSNPIDYALNIDCAKEISMLQRTDKGKDARQYFINCEKQLNAPKSPDEIILTAMQTLQGRVEEYKMQLVRQKDYF